MLYALVLAALMADLNMSTATGGSLASLTLAASAVGGILFGVLPIVSAGFAHSSGASSPTPCSQQLVALRSRCVSSRCSVSSWASVWAVNGRAVQRSSRRRGRLSIEARRLDSCKVPGLLDTLLQPS